MIKPLTTPCVSHGSSVRADTESVLRVPWGDELEVEAVPETSGATEAPVEGPRTSRSPEEKTGRTPEEGAGPAPAEESGRTGEETPGKAPEQTPATSDVTGTGASDAAESPEGPDAPEAPEAPDAPEVVEVSEASDVAGGPAVRRRRRGRTTLLIATAAVLGLVAGTCAGFLVQADREPTGLPSLSQPVVAQARGAGPEPLSAAQDHQVKADGDLRKLLLTRPKGAREADFVAGGDGWLTMAEYAEQLKNPDREFSQLVGAEFRRAADTAWQVGNAYTVDIRLVQFRQEENLAASDRANDWNVEGKHGWPIPGTGDGMAYVSNKPETQPGYLPLYSAEAHAWRGDISMEIWIYGTGPIPKAKIMDVAKRQMERL